VVLQDLLDAMLADYVVAGKKSSRHVETAYRHLSEYFGVDKIVQEITFTIVTGYARHRMQTENAAPATVKREVSFLRRGMRLLERDGTVRPPPFPEIKVRNVRKVFFEEHQYRAVRDQLHDDLGWMVEFMWFTGWRSGEVRNLQWRSIDLDLGTVSLHQDETKGEDARVFPFRFFPDFERLIKEQRARTDLIEREFAQIIPWVFYRVRRYRWAKHRGGTQIRRFSGAWNIACERAGYPGKKPHDLRRTAVKRLEDAGVSRKDAMRMVGHKTEEMYERYNIRTGRDLDDAVKKLAAFMGRKKPEAPDKPAP